MATKKITRKQVAALRYLIFNSKDANDTAKRVMAFLLAKSKNLTREVCLTLTNGKEGYSAKEINAAAFNGMMSCNGSTHLNEIMQVAATDFCFSLHYGHYRKAAGLNTDGQFRVDHVDAPIRYTFWLAKGHYSQKATRVHATRKKLEEINLKKSGLYPTLERE